MRLSSIRNWTSLCACLFVSACTGGGGSQGTTDPALQFSLAGAISAYFQAGHDFMVSAADGANLYTAQVNYKPDGTTTFNGEPASSGDYTIIMSRNGVPEFTETYTVYFQASPFRFLGSSNLGGGSYTVYANQQALPDMATVGQSGALDEFTTFTDGSQSATLETGAQQWGLVSDTQDTAWACIETNTLADGGVVTLTDECFRIDTTGNIQGNQGYSMTRVVDGVLLSFF